VTHCGKLGRDDGRLDWKKDANSLERIIRAYEPWPGTTAEWNDQGETRKLKIHPPVSVVQGNGSPPGTVLDNSTRLVVSCGKGALVLNGDIQLEGRRRLPVADFLRGVDLPVGTILG
jgi:methionyl-tRNA formyltransferase